MLPKLALSALHILTELTDLNIEFAQMHHFKPVMRSLCLNYVCKMLEYGKREKLAHVTYLRFVWLCASLDLVGFDEARL